MFTGIIEETGKITEITKDKSKNIILGIQARNILTDLKIGDSVAVNGVCLTVTNIQKENIYFNVMPVTFKDTALADYKRGSKVNLERAALLNTRLGGHLVSGHIDCTGVIKKISKEQKQYSINIQFDHQYGKYVIDKGSVAVDGISLTVQGIGKNNLTVGIIPHTLDNTNLADIQPGARVNLEFDVIGKYVEKMFGQSIKSRKINKYILR